LRIKGHPPQDIFLNGKNFLIFLRIICYRGWVNWQAVLSIAEKEFPCPLFITGERIVYGSLASGDYSLLSSGRLWWL
jgi:hypothetical protein